MRCSDRTPTLQENLPRLPDSTQLVLPLPPVPSFNRQKFSQCLRCSSVHMSVADADHCRQANAQREQF